jgi:hypothetical protein
MNIKSRVIIFLIVVALAAAAATSIYSTIVKYQGIPFPYDSAGHAYEGLRIAEDLKAGGIISFIADTYRQAFWPFFHSWVLAPAFIMFGNTYSVARAASMFCFIIFIPALYFTAAEMSETRGHWVGLIVVCLALTSLPLLVLSAMSMSEIPGLMMTFLTFLFYMKALRSGKSFLYVCAGVLMSLTFFTKWHHGVFVIAAIFITQLTYTKKLFCRTNYSLLLPFVLIMAGWFIYPRHLSSFYFATTFQPHYYKFLSLENFLFYPNSFLHTYNASLIVAVVIAACFIFSLKNIKDPRVRLLAIQIFFGLILMTIKLDKRDRYIVTMVPSVWILGATQLVDIVHQLKSRITDNRIRFSLAFVMIAGILAISFLKVPAVYKKYPNSLVKYNYYSDEKPGKAYEFISENVDKHGHIAVFGTWDSYNSLHSTTIRWNIEVRRSNDLILWKNKKEKAHYYFNQLLKNRDGGSFRDFIEFLENKDVIVTEYNLLSFMKALDAEAYLDFRRAKSINPFTDKIAALNSLDGHITCLVTVYEAGEKNINSYAEQFFSGQNEWKEVNRRVFDDLGMTITIYERAGVSTAYIK